MKITILRHGASTGNLAGVVQGQSDYPLADLGRRQMRALAEHWLESSAAFNQIISSPLSRARECAEILARTLSVPLQIDDVWKERNHGAAEGMPGDQVREWYSSRPSPSPYEPIFEDGESEWDLFRRAARAVRTLVVKPEGNYLVVSHGGILSAVLRAIAGIAPSAGRHLPIRFAHANSGYSRLSYDDDLARWTFHALNITCHLDGIGEQT